MSLIERKGQLSELDTLVDELLAGRGAIAMISGRVACGKTDLLHVFTERASESGALVLTATAAAVDQALPLGVVNQLLRSAGRTVESAGAPQAFYEALLELAARYPLVLAIDDVQDTDLASWQCLSYVICRMRRDRIAMVLTERIALMSTERPWFLGEVERESHCRTLRVTPLSRQGVKQVIAEQYDAERADRLAAEFYDLSQGSPLLVRALLQDLAHADAEASTPVAAAAGESFGRAVLSYLNRCGTLVLRLARGIAVLDEMVSPGLLDKLVDVQPGAAEQAIAGLTDAGLLRGGRLPHPAARSAVLNSLSGQERSEIYLRAAWLLHRAGESAELVARLLTAAGPAAEPWVTQVLCEAARQLLGRHEVQQAIGLLELALRSNRDDRTAAMITALLAGANARLSPATALTYLPGLTAAFERGDLSVPDCLLLLRLYLWQGRTAEARQVLAWLDSAPREQNAADLQATKLWLAGTYPGLLPNLTLAEARLAAGRGSALATATVPQLTAGSALAGLLTGGPGGTQVADAVRVLQCFRLGLRPMEAIESALLVLVYADRLSNAADWCERFRDEAAARQSPAWQNLLRVIEAFIALRHGDMSTAAALSTEALTEIDPAAWGVIVGLPLSTLVSATTAMGDLAAAARHLDVPVPDAMYQTRYGLQYLEARGGYHLAAGRHHAAYADFSACGELMRDWGIDTPAFIPWRAGAAEALLAVGRRGRARQLAEEQLSLSGEGSSRAYGISLRLLAATAEQPERSRALNEAVRVLESCADRYQLALALIDLSQAHKAAGLSGVARVTRHRAWSVARACRAEVLCQSLMPAAAGPQQRAGSGRDRESGPLTGAEQRVAVLAAEGHSNREIASKLCITTSTVEQHLTQVYRKLRIKQRTDLFESLHGGGLLRVA